jgi:hypothetical protein
MSGSEEYRPEMVDVFQEVQDIGRAIVYEFLCKVGSDMTVLYVCHNKFVS